MLIQSHLTLSRPHPAFPTSGTQHIYDLGKGYGLSVVNPPQLHYYPFAWEIAVVKIEQTAPLDFSITIDYSTPLTQDVEVFETDEQANAFIQKAIDWVAGL